MSGIGRFGGEFGFRNTGTHNYESSVSSENEFEAHASTSGVPRGSSQQGSSWAQSSYPGAAPPPREPQAATYPTASGYDRSSPRPGSGYDGPPPTAGGGHSGYSLPRPQDLVPIHQQTIFRNTQDGNLWSASQRAEGDELVRQFGPIHTPYTPPQHGAGHPDSAASGSQRERRVSPYSRDHLTNQVAADIAFQQYLPPRDARQLLHEVNVWRQPPRHSPVISRDYELRDIEPIIENAWAQVSSSLASRPPAALPSAPSMDELNTGMRRLTSPSAGASPHFAGSGSSSYEAPREDRGKRPAVRTPSDAPSPQRRRPGSDEENSSGEQGSDLEARDMGAAQRQSRETYLAQRQQSQRDANSGEGSSRGPGVLGIPVALDGRSSVAADPSPLPAWRAPTAAGELHNPLTPPPVPHPDPATMPRFPANGSTGKGKNRQLTGEGDKWVRARAIENYKRKDMQNALKGDTTQRRRLIGEGWPDGVEHVASGSLSSAQKDYVHRSGLPSRDLEAKFNVSASTIKLERATNTTEPLPEGAVEGMGRDRRLTDPIGINWVGRQIRVLENGREAVANVVGGHRQVAVEMVREALAIYDQRHQSAGIRKNSKK
jgi:hypothetical protein